MEKKRLTIELAGAGFDSGNKEFILTEGDSLRVTWPEGDGAKVDFEFGQSGLLVNFVPPGGVAIQKKHMPGSPGIAIARKLELEPN